MATKTLFEAAPRAAPFVYYTVESTTLEADFSNLEDPWLRLTDWKGRTIVELLGVQVWNHWRGQIGMLAKARCNELNRHRCTNLWHEELVSHANDLGLRP